MVRKVSLVMVAVVVGLGAAACSSTSTSTTNTTAAAPGTTPGTSGSSSDTAKPNSTAKTPGTSKTSGTKKPPTKTPITKPSDIDASSIDRSKIPTGASGADSLNGLTQDEKDCIDVVVYKTVTDDPTIADNEAQLAGVAGGAIVACVDKDKLINFLIQGLKATPQGKQLSAADLDCVAAALDAEGSDNAAFLIGALILDDQSVIAEATAPYEEDCGVVLH